jgi:hypothetical protein
MSIESEFPYTVRIMTTVPVGQGISKFHEENFYDFIVLSSIPMSDVYRVVYGFRNESLATYFKLKFG